MTQDKHDPSDLLHKYFLREGDNISHRTDWFLVFHAILLEAFFAAKHPESGTTAPLEIPVLCFGLGTSLLWLLIGLRQNWTMQLLKEAIRTKDVLTSEDGKALQKVLGAVRDSQNHTPGWYKWVRATPVFAVVIPTLTLSTWAALFLANAGLHVGWGLAITLVLLTVAIVVVTRTGTLQDALKELTNALNRP